MNRNIKFRVWLKDEKRFYFFDLHKNSPLSNHSIETILSNKKQQYTGLKDIKGREIYEGDIFKGGDYQWDCVKFEDGRFYANLLGARIFTLEELCCDIDSPKPEIIGNIYQNPNLIK